MNVTAGIARGSLPPKKLQKMAQSLQEKNIFKKNQSEGKDHVIHIHREIA